MTISIIAAMGQGNRVIGKDNQLLWHVPTDMEFFKQMTTGNIVVMGRNTYESIGKPLPNRKNIVLSSALVPANGVYFYDEKFGDVIFTRNTDIILKYANSHEIFIIGGEQVYKQFMNLADYIFLTTIHGNFEGDTFFPEIDENDFMIEETPIVRLDEESGLYLTITAYKRQS